MNTMLAKLWGEVQRAERLVKLYESREGNEWREAMDTLSAALGRYIEELSRIHKYADSLSDTKPSKYRH